MLVLVSKNKIKKIAMDRKEANKLIDEQKAIGPLLNVKGFVIYLKDLPSVSTYKGNVSDLVNLEHIEYQLV